MTTHTPGPWEWVGRDLESNFPGHYEAVIESTVSCGSFCYGGSVDMKISDADRRLIAAAPDLLEALRDALKAEEEAIESVSAWAAALGVHPDLHARIEKMRSAVAKSTGTA